MESMAFGIMEAYGWVVRLVTTCQPSPAFSVLRTEFISFEVPLDTVNTACCYRSCFSRYEAGNTLLAEIMLGIHYS